MLAQNFKTANDLCISDAEFKALINVLGRLERLEIPAKLFTMETIGRPGCGTAGCILGWARTVAKKGRDLFDCTRRTPPLQNLFYPGFDEGYEASRSEAAMALRNYLTTGTARWREIFPA